MNIKTQEDAVQAIEDVLAYLGEENTITLAEKEEGAGVLKTIYSVAKNSVLVTENMLDIDIAKHEKVLETLKNEKSKLTL